MEALVSKARTIRLPLQPARPSETSAFNNIRAFNSRRAGLLPFRMRASSRSRSSALNRTTYFFTEISFVDMMTTPAQIIARGVNHPAPEKGITNSIQIDRRGRLEPEPLILPE